MLTGLDCTYEMILRKQKAKRPWRPEDDNKLREMAGAGNSIIMMSHKLKRTASAVRGRASILKVPIRGGQKEANGDGMILTEQKDVN
jgi:hypothetical protein